VGVLGGRTLVPETIIHVSGSTVLKLVRVEEDDVEFTEGINQGSSQEGQEAEGDELVEGVHCWLITPSGQVYLYPHQSSIKR